MSYLPEGIVGTVVSPRYGAVRATDEQGMPAASTPFASSLEPQEDDHSPREAHVKITVAPGSEKSSSDYHGDPGKAAAGRISTLLRRPWVLAGLIVGLILITLIPVAIVLSRMDRRGSNPLVGPSGAKESGGPWALQCAKVELNTTALGNILSGQTPPALRIQDGRLVDVTTSKEVVLHGVNWFGFENNQTFVDGLWAADNNIIGDFATVVHQLKLLGFNAIRLPFKFLDLELPPKEQSKWCPVWYTNEEVARRVLDPNVTRGLNNGAPQPDHLVTVTKNQCSSYIPQKSTISRYLWTVLYMVRSGMYVLVDYHPQEGENIPHNVKETTERWVQLWSKIACMPSFQSELQGRLFLDVLNEPDVHKMGWDKGLHPSITELYITVMDALDQLTPGAPIYFIQGGGQAKFGISWGDGFVTDQTLIRQRGLHDPNPFFQQLLTKSYRDRVVLAPHLYGHSVTKTTEVGKLQFDKYSASFGELQKKGYCNANGSVCQRFPVVPGEIGSRFEDPHDVQYYEDMVRYFKLQGDGDDGRHEEMRSYFYWAYNGNSHDVGGLVTDDWTKVEWTKIRFLVNNLGLKPWYLQQ